MKYWLIKSEESTYSIDDLKRDTVVDWFGIRNYQARNFMRDEMKIGDLVLFYHSNSKPSGIFGIASVASEPHPDEKAFDKTHQYFDARSTVEKPMWICVDFMFAEKFNQAISLDQLKRIQECEGMLVTKKGQRLSIQPVAEKHFKHIYSLGMNN